MGEGGEAGVHSRLPGRGWLAERAAAIGRGGGLLLSLACRAARLLDSKSVELRWGSVRGQAASLNSRPRTFSIIFYPIRLPGRALAGQ